MRSQDEVHDAQGPDILEAIFDVVEGGSSADGKTARHRFRATAQVHVDIPAEVDRLLPITSRQTWVAIICAGIALLAGILYLAGATQTTSVTAIGRVVGPDGVTTIGSPDALVVDQIQVRAGSLVNAGDVLATAADSAGGQVAIRSPIDGSVWQVLVSQAQVLERGEALFTVLPTGSDTNVLVPIAADAASGVQVGQSATITSGSAMVNGVVAQVEATPLPAPRAGFVTSLVLDPRADYISVVVRAAAPIRPGTEVSVEIVQSESSFLGELVSFR